jgi:hypothetical protein
VPDCTNEDNVCALPWIVYGIGLLAADSSYVVMKQSVCVYVSVGIAALYFGDKIIQPER